VLDGLSPTSWTLPAMASLLTGLHPVRHQALAVEDSLSPQALTLAEALGSRGFDTCAVTANGFTGPAHGLDQGFRRSIFMGDVGAGPFARAGQVNRQARGCLDRLRPPFFLMLHYLDPHAPYEGPDWAEGWYSSGPARRAVVSIEELQMAAAYDRPAGLLQRARDAYDAEIRRTDEALGQVLDGLARRGLLDQTLTVVTSDHGEEFQEHGRMGHGQTLHEEVVRVPLVLRWPGRLPPGRPGSASLLDLAPTVLGLLGQAGALPAAQGRDLSAELTLGQNLPALPPQLLHLDQGGIHALALRTSGEKLLLARHPLLRGLYDLAADPGERANLWPSRPDAVARLGRELVAAYRAALPGALPRAILERVPRKEELAALGYVAPPAPRPRGIPGRIEPPDPDEQGSLGWGDEASWRACIDPTAPSAEGQLHTGWYAGDEAGGRASLPQAAVRFPVPARGGEMVVTLTGWKPDSEPARLVVRGAGRVLADEALVARGEFRVEARVAAPAGQRLRLELERRPPLAETRDPRTGRSDLRPRGFVWRSLCARPAPGRSAPPPL
jgi:arylsulfatase A-like enzyme